MEMPGAPGGTGSDGYAGKPGGTGSAAGNPGTQKQPESAEDPAFSALPFQFVRTCGIVKSDDPVYELESTVQLEFPQKEKTLILTSALCHKQELIVSAILMSPSAETLPPGSEPPADRKYTKLPDGRLLISETYQERAVVLGRRPVPDGTGTPAGRDQAGGIHVPCRCPSISRHTKVCVTGLRRVSSFQLPFRAKTRCPGMPFRFSILKIPWNFP